MYVDPHQLRDIEAYGGPVVRVASGRVDLEAPAAAGHPTAVIAQASRVEETAGNGDDGVTAVFNVPVHLRYSTPTRAGAPTTFPIERPQQVVLTCQGARFQGMSRRLLVPCSLSGGAS